MLPYFYTTSQVSVAKYTPEQGTVKARIFLHIDIWPVRPYLYIVIKLCYVSRYDNTKHKLKIKNQRTYLIH